MRYFLSYKLKIRYVFVLIFQMNSFFFNNSSEMQSHQNNKALFNNKNVCNIVTKNVCNIVTKSQVSLAASFHESQTLEIGADKKGKKQNLEEDNLEERGLLSKAHLYISVQAEIFISKGREGKTNGQGEEFEQLSTCRPALSISIRMLKLVKRGYGVHHPGLHNPASTIEGKENSSEWDD